MAKPTAFIDAVIFGLILVGLWLNGISLIGGGIALLGLLGIIQPLFTAAFITPALGKVLLVIGGLIAL